jgi:xylan 1,4-beta-xylosidase
MSGRRLTVESDHGVPLDTMLRAGVRDQPDVSALASRDRNKVWVLVWHYHDDDLPGPDAAVDLTLEGLPGADRQAKLEHFRIDEDHSNAFSAWKRLGSPAQPTPEQYTQLESAGHLAVLRPVESVPIHDGKVVLGFGLPRQAVSLLKLTLSD